MMLQLDPEKRPNCSQIMAHPWLAPHLFRLVVSLGSLPCCTTSKAIKSPQASSSSLAPSRTAAASVLPCTLTQIVKVELDDQGKSTKAPLRVNNVTHLS